MKTKKLLRLFQDIFYIVVLAIAVPSSYAASIQSGAYDDFFQDGVMICISDADIAQMQADQWLKEMSRRGKSCHITESDSAMPSLRRWRAKCTDAGSRSLQYAFTVNATATAKGETLTIDSSIKDDAGRLEFKKALQGKRQSACNASTVAFKVWDYFDLPENLPNDRAAKTVAGELLYCGALYSGLSRFVSAQKRTDFLQLGASLTSNAAALFPDDPDFLKTTLEKVANRVASELVGANAERLFELSQLPVCQPYLVPGGVEAALHTKNAEFDTKSR